MVEVKQLCKKQFYSIIFFKESNKIKKSAAQRGGGLQPPQPLPWIRLCTEKKSCRKGARTTSVKKEQDNQKLALCDLVREPDVL